MQERLLNAYIAGSIGEAKFKAKSDDLKAQIAAVDESLVSVEDIDEGCAETALQLFDWRAGGGAVARFKQCRSPRDLGCGLFEPYFERRRSRHRKEKAA